MRTPLLAVAFGLSALFLAGCGGDEKVAATGTVLMDGKPMPAVALTFHPIDGTKGAGGFAATDDSGTFHVIDPQGGKGIARGKYKVTFERLPTKKPVDEKDAITRVLAVVPLPAVYTDVDKTPVTATVESAEVPIELRLESKPKP